MRIKGKAVETKMAGCTKHHTEAKTIYAVYGWVHEVRVWDCIDEYRTLKEAQVSADRKRTRGDYSATVILEERLPKIEYERIG